MGEAGAKVGPDHIARWMAAWYRIGGSGGGFFEQPNVFSCNLRAKVDRRLIREKVAERPQPIKTYIGET